MGLASKLLTTKGKVITLPARRGIRAAAIGFSPEFRAAAWKRTSTEVGTMTAQRKITRRTSARRISAKDREFEGLLRRAALYAKAQPATKLPITSRKRVAAA
jgi:hypothetical protein